MSRIIATALLAGLACACTPIEINMNINIKHEILIKVEKEVEQLFDEDKGLF